MAGTFTQMYIQVVFAVKGRENLISPEHKLEINKYIAGIIREKKHKPIIVNGMADHLHVFFGLNPSLSVSDLVRDIKNNSSNFINREKWAIKKFAWQEGYGSFSYTHEHIDRVYQYILRQEEHHRAKKFREEYTELLQQFSISFDERYLFDWYD